VAEKSVPHTLFSSFVELGRALEFFMLTMDYRTTFLRLPQCQNIDYPTDTGGQLLDLSVSKLNLRTIGYWVFKKLSAAQL
jgi:hypothetical protein